MGVRGRDGGPLLVSDEEMEAASMLCFANIVTVVGHLLTELILGFYHAFCFYKI